MSTRSHLSRFTSPHNQQMKSELYFIAKMAVVLSIVDAFIPRAETYAKHKLSNCNNTEQTTKGTPQISHEQPYQKTEVHMGLFGLKPFHGSGSGGSKAALDEQFEIQRPKPRERQGHLDNAHLKEKYKSPKIEVDMDSAKKVGGKMVVVDELDGHRPKFFWGK